MELHKKFEELLASYGFTYYDTYDSCAYYTNGNVFLTFNADSINIRTLDREYLRPNNERMLGFYSTVEELQMLLNEKYFPYFDTYKNKQYIKKD